MSGLPGRVDTILRTAFAGLAIPIEIALHCATAVAMALAGAPAARVHRLYLSACRIGLWMLATRLSVEGARHAEPGQAYVVVANHESNWDPLCLIVALPEVVIRFVAKQQIMSLPVLGPTLRVTGNVRVVRTETDADVDRIRSAMGEREPDVSMLFFAEGHRSRDGALHPFKNGAFATALGYGLPILPIGIAGTRPIWSADSPWLRRGSVAVQVGEPIPTAGLTLDDRHALRDRAFKAVRDLRGRARQHLRDAGVDPGGVD